MVYKMAAATGHRTLGFCWEMANVLEKMNG